MKDLISLCKVVCGISTFYYRGNSNKIFLFHLFKNSSVKVNKSLVRHVEATLKFLVKTQVSPGD